MANWKLLAAAIAVYYLFDWGLNGFPFAWPW